MPGTFFTSTKPDRAQPVLLGTRCMPLQTPRFSRSTAEVWDKVGHVVVAAAGQFSALGVDPWHSMLTS